jgi:hypothetical protein
MKKFSVVVVFVAFALTAIAQTPPDQPRFKGHVIGETVAEFLSVARDRDRHLTRDWCKLVLSGPSKHGNDVVADSLRDMELERCRNIDRVIQTGEGTILSSSAVELGMSGSATFQDGRFVMLRFEAEDTFDHVVADISNKVKKEASLATIPYQNGFGAHFDCPAAGWSTASIDARIEQKPPSSYPSTLIEVSVWDHSWAVSAAKKAEQNRKSSVD